MHDTDPATGTWDDDCVKLTVAIPADSYTVSKVGSPSQIVVPGSATITMAGLGLTVIVNVRGVPLHPTAGNDGVTKVIPQPPAILPTSPPAISVTYKLQVPL